MDKHLLSWTFLRKNILSYRSQLFKAHIIAIVATLISVPIPMMMPLLVDEVLLNSPGSAVETINRLLPLEWQTASSYILFILFVVCMMRLFSLFFSVLQSREFTFIGKQISYEIRERAVLQLPKISLKEYETLGAAGVSSRCVTDIETLDNFVSSTLSRFLISVLTIIGVAIVLIWIDWQLGLIILLLNPAVIYFSRSFGKKVRQLKKKENAAYEAFQLSLVETLDAIHQLRTLNREKNYFNRVIDAAQDVKHSAIQSNWKTDALNRLSFSVFLLGFEVFRAIGMLMVVTSDLSVGEIFAVFGYLWFMMGPVQDLLSMQYSYFSAQAALKRLNDVLTLPKEPEYPCLKDPFNTMSEGVKVEIKDLGFSYQENKPILKGISLIIQPGQKAALVSMSGGGKSTLIQLMLGLYEKTSGQILYNNTPIENIGYQTVRTHVATVLQQPVLLNDTIKENLCMGQFHTDNDIWKALDLAEMQATVNEMSQKLETLVGRNGLKLSGGQRQRLAIARMILSNPDLVILDEATSALDIETEAKILKNLDQFLEGRSSLIIAHRLSAIQHADVIYVLDDGYLTQSGNHKALLEQQGLYQTLYADKS